MFRKHLPCANLLGSEPPRSKAGDSVYSGNDTGAGLSRMSRSLPSEEVRKGTWVRGPPLKGRGVCGDRGEAYYGRR